MKSTDDTTTDDPNRTVTDGGLAAVEPEAETEPTVDDEPLSIESTGLGHEYVSETGPRDGERPVYIHRLAAVAWGLLDGLDDPRHVHHAVPVEWLDDADTRAAGIPWLTTESTLIAEDPSEHAPRHHFGGDR